LRSTVWGQFILPAPEQGIFISPLKLKWISITYKDWVRVSQRIQPASIRVINRKILYRETIAIYWHTRHTHTHTHTHTYIYIYIYIYCVGTMQKC
jgi:hypothetical protein